MPANARVTRMLSIFSCQFTYDSVCDKHPEHTLSCQNGVKAHEFEDNLHLAGKHAFKPMKTAFFQSKAGLQDSLFIHLLC